ncbi:MAG: succinylglutamate desuccinylase/aspartoacylase family protein [Nannocystaceae bacterium]
MSRVGREPEDLAELGDGGGELGLAGVPVVRLVRAVHGDELNGIEIVRRLLCHKGIKRLRGTLVAVPFVNAYGVLHHSRYLPDRRDLNRSFPGSERGSLAGRVAHVFMTEIVSTCTHGIDLHTGAIHRSNLPQVRAQLADPETERLARSFGVPVILNARLRDGSLRGEAAEHGLRMLLYEAGEALRFDEMAIRSGVRGVLNVMSALDMLPKRKEPPSTPFIAEGTRWIRAPESGVVRQVQPLGAKIEKNGTVAIVSSPLGDDELEVRSPVEGVVIGRTCIPLVHAGEALVHIATFEEHDEAAERVEAFRRRTADDVAFEEVD